MRPVAGDGGGDRRAVRLDAYQRGPDRDLFDDFLRIEPDQMLDRLVGGADREIDLGFSGGATPAVLRLDAQPVGPRAGAGGDNAECDGGKPALARIPTRPYRPVGGRPGQIPRR